MMAKRSLFGNTIRILFSVLAYYAVPASTLFPLPEAHAHPHVFIVQRLNVVFDDMFASMIIEDHDLNRNGALEPKEVSTIKEKAFAYISEYGYFTFIKIENTPFQVRLIKDFNAFLENNVLVYKLLIPCHVTATNHLKKVSVATYDPSYYSAIFFAGKRPVSLTDDDGFEVKTAVRKDPDTKIYYDMVHPWTLFLEFRKKP